MALPAFAKATPGDNTVPIVRPRATLEAANAVILVDMMGSFSVSAPAFGSGWRWCCRCWTTDLMPKGQRLRLSRTLLPKGRLGKGWRSYSANEQRDHSGPAEPSGPRRLRRA